MLDLHGWITRQIDDREQLAELISPGGYAPDEWRIEPSRSGRWVEIFAYSRTNIEPPEAASREQVVALTQTGRNEHLLIAMHDPASVLRRCAADRKILAEHAPYGGKSWSAYACTGCGEIRDDWVTDHTNDCPTLLALAEGYGLTEGQRAALDRPEPVRPEPTGPSLISDAVAENIYGNLLRVVQATHTGWLTGSHVKVVDVTPPRSAPRWFATPGEQAFAVVEPYLSAVALYKPDTSTEA